MDTLSHWLLARQRLLGCLSRMKRLISIFVTGLLVLAAACISTNPEAEWSFRHGRDRLDTGVTAEQLEDITFYLSQEVRLRKPVDDTMTDANEVIILPKLAEGRLVETGANWLRVSFSDRVDRVFFVTDPDKPDDYYYIATSVAGQTTFERLADRDPATIEFEGANCEVIMGKWANLQVDAEGWQDFLEYARDLSAHD